MSKSKDEKIAELEQAVSKLTADRILDKEPEMFKTYHVENDQHYEVSHSQAVVCADCAFDNGELAGGFGSYGKGYCACGRSNSNNTPIGEYDWEDDSID